MELPAVIDLASMVTNGLVAARSALYTTRAGEQQPDRRSGGCDPSASPRLRGEISCQT